MNILIGYSKSELANSMVSSIEKEQILSRIQDKLESYGLTVTKLGYQESAVKEHLWVRDNFFTLAGNCFICNMTNCDTLKHNRKLEQKNIIKFLETKFDKMIEIPFPIEGGDVLVTENDVFVGIGKRTSIEAFNFLKNHFINVRFHKIEHRDLHSDCCFSVLDNTVFFNKSKILSFEDIMNIQLTTITPFEFIDIDKIDTGELNTNFIVSSNVVFHGSISDKMSNLIVSKGYDLVQITDINKMYTEGGGIRCLTQFF